MSKQGNRYAGEFRRQMVELARAGRGGAPIEVLGPAEDSLLDIGFAEWDHAANSSRASSRADHGTGCTS